jgi:cytochrome c2
MWMRRYVLLCAFLTILVIPLAAQTPSKSSAAKKSHTAGKSGVNPAAVKAGQAVFTRYCALCHLNTSTEKKIGPGLKGIGKKEKFSSGDKITDDSLRAWIENGGKNMPGFKQTLSAEEIHDLIAYIKTL